MQRAHCGWFTVADQERSLAGPPPRQPLKSFPISELQKLDKRVRQATSEGARRAILQGNRRNKLLALLVARHRYHGGTEDEIEQLVEDFTLKNRNQIAEDILTAVGSDALRNFRRPY